VIPGLLLLAVTCVSVKPGADNAPAIDAGSIMRVCTESDLAGREILPVPGATTRPGVASPTRAPWIDANGWRFTRTPDGKFAYDVPRGTAALAAAEAFAYGANVTLKIDRADAGSLTAMLTFLKGVPSVDLPAIADLAVVDDGSAITGEVMNLLSRRNLLFQPVRAPSNRFRINVAVGTPAYPREEAANPSAFALKIRRELGDEQRALRIYGSEVVIGRLTGDATRIRLHLLNYGAREIEGLRVRIRGAYGTGTVYVAGSDRLQLQDQVVADGSTEFSLPSITTYAVIDLRR
jgi:hypothetical protein